MKQLFNSIKIIAIALIIGLGVSYVSAAPWAAPGAAPTGGNTVASVNVSDYAQTKIGSFITENFLKAGGAISPTGAPWNKAGYAVAEKAFISPWSFFTYSFLPGTASQVKIGSDNADTTDPFTGAITPFTIDLVGRGGYNTSSGRNMVDIRTDTNACYPNATIRTNTPAIELLNSKTGDNADVIVRGIQLSGGNPAPGKILVSTDADGNAVWGTPTLSGGQIVFTYGTSPAATGQALCSTPPVGMCKVDWTGINFEWNYTEPVEVFANNTKQLLAKCAVPQFRPGYIETINDVTACVKVTSENYTGIGWAVYSMGGGKYEWAKVTFSNNLITKVELIDQSTYGQCNEGANLCTDGSWENTPVCSINSFIYKRTQNTPTDTGNYDPGFARLRGCLVKANNTSNPDTCQALYFEDGPAPTTPAGYSFARSCSEISPDNLEQYDMYTMQTMSCPRYTAYQCHSGSWREPTNPVSCPGGAPIYTAGPNATSGLPEGAVVCATTRPSNSACLYNPQ